jgi:TetR/AcrR family transcriptional repressor of nem operon
MRYSKTHKEETHKRIVTTAAKSFRKHGINGVGVVPLMKESGLTHGGFYAHFKSKDALVGAAIDAAFEQTIGRLKQAVDNAPQKSSVRAFIDEYLSEGHRDDPSAGCAVAAFGTETARLKPTIREHIDKNIESMLAVMTDDRNHRVPREEAIRTLSTAIGAMVLARTVRSKELSDEVLTAARRIR